MSPLDADQQNCTLPGGQLADIADSEGTSTDRELTETSETCGLSPSVIKVERSWRSGIAAICILTGWLLLMARLVELQGARREQLNERVAQQSQFQEVIPARPGEILDRNGQVLAMTVQTESLYAVPEKIDRPLEWAWQISSILNLNTDELCERLQEHRERQFLWIKRRITDEQAAAIRALGLKKGTWGLRREYLRQYLQEGYASHVVGVRDIDNHGRGGLEEGLNSQLRGTDGVRVMTRDARGLIMEVEASSSRAPSHGRSVVSSIDLRMQIQAEQCLDELVEQWKPVGACAIVMQPHTGEILAMVSRPTFSPGALLEVPEAAWKNLAISAVFEPGSTFKPFIAGWAIEHGVVQRDESIHCSFGAYRMGPRILHDHHSYGALSVEDVLVKSSNIGMAKIGERLGLRALYEATCSFGFGRRTGIELSGELSGLVHPFSQWTIYSLGSIPMGQELSVTPLQLITAHAVLANGGRLVRPTLVCRSPELLTAGPQEGLISEGVEIHSALMSSETAAWLVQHPMRNVVERGTGKAARIPGFSMFGKTGTAQKLDPDTGTYSDTAWVVSFVCGAPAEDPKVLVLVMVDEPTAPGIHYGGTVAAPTAARILQFATARVTELGLPAASPANRMTKAPSLSEETQ